VPDQQKYLTLIVVHGSLFNYTQMRRFRAGDDNLSSQTARVHLARPRSGFSFSRLDRRGMESIPR